MSKEDKSQWAPKPEGMNYHSYAMGQRQIAQAKARGGWRGNNY